MENQLIQLYLLVCQIYDNQSSLKYQRRSNFKPLFSDRELMTVYLFGHLNGLYQKKAIHCFTRNYWADWFPALSSYQAFNRRLNLLEPAFHSIGRVLLNTFKGEQAAEIDHLIDSMPVMLASGASHHAPALLGMSPIAVIVRRNACIFTAFGCISSLPEESDNFRCRKPSGCEKRQFTI